MMIRCALVLGLLAVLAGCGDADSYDNYDADAAEEVAEEARQAIYDELGADSDGTGSDPHNVDAYSVEDSGNYTCTQDCSGHEAGFEWAQENDIGDSTDCGGYSDSFIEGCEAFADARQEEADYETQRAAEEAAAETEEDAEYETEGY